MIGASLDTRFQSLYYKAFLVLLERYLEKISSAGDGTADKQGNFAQIIKAISERYQVDPDLVQAVVKAESNFDARAVSPAGAEGLMQLMPETAESLGVSNAFDPVENVDGGVRYLRMLLSQFGGDVELALAGYNAGPGAVAEHGGVPPYEETQAYVQRVMSYYAESKNSWSA